MALNLPLVGDAIFVSRPGEPDNEVEYVIVDTVDNGFHIKPIADQSENPSLISYNFRDNNWKVVDAGGNYLDYIVRIEFDAINHLNTVEEGGRNYWIDTIKGVFMGMYDPDTPGEKSLDEMKESLDSVGLWSQFEPSGLEIHRVTKKDLYDCLHTYLMAPGPSVQRKTERVVYLLDWLRRNYLINPEQMLLLTLKSVSINRFIGEALLIWMLDNSVTFEGLDYHNASEWIANYFITDHPDEVDLFRLILRIPGLENDFIGDGDYAEQAEFIRKNLQRPHSKIADYIEFEMGANPTKPARRKHSKSPVPAAIPTISPVLTPPAISPEPVGPQLQPPAQQPIQQPRITARRWEGRDDLIYTIPGPTDVPDDLVIDVSGGIYNPVVIGKKVGDEIDRHLSNEEIEAIRRSGLNISDEIIPPTMIKSAGKK